MCNFTLSERTTFLSHKNYEGKIVLKYSEEMFSVKLNNCFPLSCEPVGCHSFFGLLKSLKLFKEA